MFFASWGNFFLIWLPPVMQCTLAAIIWWTHDQFVCENSAVLHIFHYSEYLSITSKNIKTSLHFDMLFDFTLFWPSLNYKMFEVGGLSLLWCLNRQWFVLYLIERLVSTLISQNYKKNININTKFITSIFIITTIIVIFITIR